MRAKTNASSTILAPLSLHNFNSSPSTHAGRRKASIKSTMNWLKGGNKNSSSGVAVKKKDISNPIAARQSSPTIVTFLAPSTTIHEITESAADTQTQQQTTNTSVPRPLHCEVTSPIAVDGLPVKLEIGSTSSPTEGDLTDLPLVKMLTNERTEVISSREIPPSRGSGKKAAVKLKLALSILRRRSNSNLRKTFYEEQKVAKINTGTSERPGSLDVGFTFTQISPNTHVVPFNSGNPRPRAVLTKQPLSDSRKQRRATVASLGYDESVGPTDHTRSNGWLNLDGRPSSSQSSMPGVATMQGDDFSATNILSPDGNGGGMNGSVVGGGLHPRPSSVKRHWSDGPQKKGESSASITEDRLSTNPSGRACQGGERIRPLSFSGIYNGYGSMKITEAASLETRIRELEAQVATLQSFLVQQKVPPVTQAEANGHLKPDTQSPTLESPFRDPSINRPVTASSVSTYLQKEMSIGDGKSTPSISTFTNTVDWTSIARSGPSTTSISRFNQAPSEVTLSDGTRDYRQRAFDTYELRAGPSIASSRRSASTITPRERGKGREVEPFNTQVSQNTVTIAEYTGLIAMVKREQRARKKLETRISKLQEQMTLVLHRQLLIQDQQQRAISPSATETSVNGGLRPGFQSLRRRASGKAPAPHPASSRGGGEMGMTIFPGFDSSRSATESEYDESYNGDAEGSELWETPTEEGQSVVDSRVDLPTLHHHLQSDNLSIPPPMQPRTMSISQITEKAASSTPTR